MSPERIRLNKQNPIMSRAFRPAIASAGRAQNGWIMLVQESPQAIAMAILA